MLLPKDFKIVKLSPEILGALIFMLLVNIIISLSFYYYYYYYYYYIYYYFNQDQV